MIYNIMAGGYAPRLPLPSAAGGFASRPPVVLYPLCQILSASLLRTPPQKNSASPLEHTHINRILGYRLIPACCKVFVDEVDCSMKTARNVFVIYKVGPIFAPPPKSAALSPALNNSYQITINCFIASVKCLSFLVYMMPYVFFLIYTSIHFTIKSGAPLSNL